MRKWECIVCGLIYDEAKGWPEDGIAPGTRWEDVPEDWLCPDCGVGKEDFELMEEQGGAAPDQAEAQQAGATGKTAAGEAAPHDAGVDQAGANQTEVPGEAEAEGPAPVVIIGTGLAGYGLAKEFRKHDKEAPLMIISSDDGRSYSKPMLSTGYTKNTTADDLAQQDAGSMGENFDAQVLTMTRVDEIDTTAQLIKVSNANKQTTIRYSKLVLAVGSEVIQPPIKGDAIEYIYSVNDLMDYDNFRKAVAQRKAKKICIVGAGLIGCEFTNDLLNGGFEVEAVDPLGYCLPTLLPEAAGKAVQRALEAKGATFHFGPLVTEVNKSGDGANVTLIVSLNNGDTIAADIVLSAVGVRPRIDLARRAGLEVNRGIVTNRLLETSAPNVYAFGDCAEVAGHVLVYVAPLMAAARALGKTLAGQPTEVSYPAMPVAIKTPACPVCVAPVAPDTPGEWTISEDGNNVRGEFRGPDGSLLGFALTGDATADKMALQKQLPPIL